MNELPLDRPAQPEVTPATAGFALWNLGFRQFYLLASIFSAISVLLWAAQFSGYLPSAYLRGRYGTAMKCCSDTRLRSSRAFC
jgi:uncharacterized protein involved in response to NO